MCGRVIGYQHSDTVAFYGLTSGVSSIEQHYLDGVSITNITAYIYRQYCLKVV